MNASGSTETNLTAISDTPERALLDRVLRLISYSLHADETLVLFPGQERRVLGNVQINTDWLVEVLGGWDRSAMVLDASQEGQIGPLLARTGAQFLTGVPVRSGDLNIAYLLVVSRSPRTVAIAPDINVLSDFACVIASLLELQFVASEARNAELKAQESEDRFRSTANTAPLLIWTATADGNWAFVNHVWLEYTGCTDAQLLYDGWLDHVHPEDRQQCSDSWLQAVANRTPFQMEHRIRCSSGGYRWVVNQALPRFLSDGAFNGFVGSCTDVTHLHLDAEQLAGGAHIGTPGWEVSGALTILLDACGRILRLNQAAATTMSLNPQTAWHKPIWEVLTKAQDRAAMRDAVLSVVEQKSACTIDTNYTEESGNDSKISWTLQAQVDEYGSVNHVICSGHDTNVGGRAEQSLRRAAAVVETSDDAIYHTNRSGTILTWNAAAERAFGYTEEEIVGKSVRLLIPPEGQSEFELLLARIDAGETSVRRTTTRLHKDGRRVQVAMAASAVRDELGKLIGKMVVARDLTEKKNREAEFRKKEALCRALIENALDLVAMVDAAGTILFVSPSCKQWLGWEPEELVGRCRFDFYHPDDRARMQTLYQRTTSTADATACVQLRFLKKDGSWCRLESRLKNLLHDSEVGGIVINARVLGD